MENVEDAPEELTEEESLAAARKARKETIHIFAFVSFVGFFSAWYVELTFR